MKNIRFNALLNGGKVKLKLEPGQALFWIEERNDYNGYARIAYKWKHNSKTVTLRVMCYICSFTGRTVRDNALYSWDRLTLDEFGFPAWKLVETWEY